MDQAAMLADYRALLSGEEVTPLGALANTAAWLAEVLADLNWAGFYLLDDAGTTLHLGPFVGRSACTVIPVGRGVCGSAAEREAPLKVPDVTRFPGHIACDHRSRSELVVPFFVPSALDGTRQLYGVLDLDSPVTGRFGDTTEALAVAVLEELARVIGPQTRGQIRWGAAKDSGD